MNANREHQCDVLVVGSGAAVAGSAGGLTGAMIGTAIAPGPGTAIGALAGLAIAATGAAVALGFISNATV